MKSLPTFLGFVFFTLFNIGMIYFAHHTKIENPFYVLILLFVFGISFSFNVIFGTIFADEIIK